MKVFLSNPVNRARAYNQPIVALESTIITHGMPFPKNVETALKVRQTVREHGATPATIAIINGQMKVGLTDDEITFMGKNAGRFVKTSRRDIPYLVAKKKHGATTVAATMIIAAMAGIKVFATGGIGGVHRGAAQSMDVSADLQELAQTNVAVVSAGAKAILDLQLTREYLETMGVPLIGYGTAELPAFYTRKSGVAVDYRLDSPKEVATFLKTKWELGLRGGVVIANPIPEAYEMEYAPINQAIETAITESEAQEVKGKDITPFLLSRIEQLTGGQSLQANIQLVLNNAKLAARIAGQM